MLEKMGDFFDARVDGYEEHQMNTIEDADIFYPFTASCLPKEEQARVLDLGCGTGLELTEYFKVNPDARVTGIDLAPEMLSVLRRKFPEKDLELIVGSYFEVPFEKEAYDAALSVESLHHFTKEEKIPLYIKLRNALKEGGYFILTDYYAKCNEDEMRWRNELLRIRREENLKDDVFYHYDTPLTAEHEIEALRAAGFSSVKVLGSWGVTSAIKAVK